MLGLDVIQLHITESEYEPQIQVALTLLNVSPCDGVPSSKAVSYVAAFVPNPPVLSIFLKGEIPCLGIESFLEVLVRPVCGSGLGGFSRRHTSHVLAIIITELYVVDELIFLGR